MKNPLLDEEKWMLYRKSDQHLPEKIIDQNGQSVCFMNERFLYDTPYEDEEIKLIELKSELIKLSPDMYRLLNEVLNCPFEESEINLCKEKIKKTISNLNI